MNIICDGTALEVDVAGSGEPVLIIHGFTGSALAMKPLSDRLPGRKSSPTLLVMVAANLPQRVPSRCCLSTTVIATRLPRRDTSIDCRIPMGGRIALNFAVNHPEKVRSLALIGVSPGIENDSDRLSRKNADNDLAASISHLGVKAFIESWVDLLMWESLRNKLTATQWQESISEL